MPVADPSLLTRNDLQYLQEHLHSYRQTATKDKEAYRKRLTKHILNTRNVSEDDEYAYICIYKVSHISWL